MMKYFPHGGNKRIFQFIYLKFYLLFGSNHDCHHDFGLLFVHFVFLNSIMLTTLHEVQFGSEKKISFNFENQRPATKRH